MVLFGLWIVVIWLLVSIIAFVGVRLFGRLVKLVCWNWCDLVFSFGFSGFILGLVCWFGSFGDGGCDWFREVSRASKFPFCG